MATLLITHEVEDVQHWLSSPRRAEFFGQLGYTVRTFIEPTDEYCKPCRHSKVLPR